MSFRGGKRVIAVTLLLFASAFAVEAQPPAKVARLGFLITGSLESPETRVSLDAFRQGLRESGYVGSERRH